MTVLPAQGFVDRCKWNATSSGTGNFVYASVVNGFLGPIAASAIDGTTYNYVAETSDHLQWETGRGSWTSSSGTLARTKIFNGSNGNSAVNFTVAPIVRITALTPDFPVYGATQATSSNWATGTAVIGNAAADPPYGNVNVGGSTESQGHQVNNGAVLTLAHQFQGPSLPGQTTGLTQCLSFANTSVSRSVQFVCVDNESILTDANIGGVPQFIGNLQNLVNKSSHSVSQFFGFEAILNQQTGSSVDRMAAVSGAPLIDCTGNTCSVNQAFCLWAQACEGFNGAGHINMAAAFSANITPFYRNGFTVTNNYGLFVGSQGESNSAITNNVGVHIEDNSDIGTAISYNFYSKGSKSINVLEGFTQQGSFKRVSSDVAVTNNATLANVTGLINTVRAARNYQFEAVLFTTSSTAGGVQAAIGGTAVPTSLIYEGTTTDTGSVLAQTRGTGIGSAVGAATSATVARIDIKGILVCSTAGNLTVQFAQNASVASASTVLQGSYFLVRDIA